MNTTPRSMELRRKRAAAINEARSILDAAEAAGRGLDGQEEERYQRFETEINDLATRIEREERTSALADELNNPLTTPVDAPGTATDQRGDASAERRALRSLFSPDRRGDVTVRLTGMEQRALAADEDIAGGYTVNPESFMAQLIKFVDNSVAVRQLATVMPVTNADSLGAPTLDADISDPTWTVELDTGSDDTSMAFGKRELHPHPLAQGIKVSRKLLRSSALPVETIVRERLGYKIGIVAENAYLNGSGANQPLGMFTASANGISTGRDVSTGNAATAFTAEGLIAAFYSCKQQYRRSGTWMMHRDGVAMSRKLKTGDGQYILVPGLTGGAVDQILGRPLVESEYVPNTFTSGLYVGIFGDMRQYWIADAMNMEIQRLDELYARTNQVGFVSRMESDGMPVLEEAFARVKLG